MPRGAGIMTMQRQGRQINTSQCAFWLIRVFHLQEVESEVLIMTEQLRSKALGRRAQS